MTRNKNVKTKRFQVGTTVWTPRGVGEISHAFPKGPRSVETYAVRFIGKKVTIVFSGDEIAILNEADRSRLKDGSMADF